MLPATTIERRLDEMEQQLLLLLEDLQDVRALHELEEGRLQAAGLTTPPAGPPATPATVAA